MLGKAWGEQWVPASFLGFISPNAMALVSLLLCRNPESTILPVQAHTHEHTRVHTQTSHAHIIFEWTTE